MTIVTVMGTGFTVTVTAVVVTSVTESAMTMKKAVVTTVSNYSDSDSDNNGSDGDSDNSDGDGDIDNSDSSGQ